jgi:UDP-2,3-diacylglucosamine pyrophosphatase LpxH
MAHIVCMSDIHFGEPYSLLWRPDLPLYAGKMVGYLAGGSIDKLILVGDVWELAAPEEPDAAFPIARAFFHALTGDRTHGTSVKELIWIPGNHDHELWSHYCQQTGKALDALGGWQLWDGTDASDDTAQHLITNMLGDDVLERIGAITVYNPLYVEHLKKGSVVFHHGHYFDDLILGKSGLDEFKARFTSLISGGWARPNSPLEATDAADLEARCAPFIDAVWGRTTDRQTLKTQAWEFLTRFRKWSSCNPKGSPDVPQFAMLGDLERDYSLPGEADNIRWFVRNFVFKNNLASDPVSLVYGHVHRGDMFDLDVDGRTVRCFNTGGWITSHPGTTPHTHVVLIDEDGNFDQRAIRFPDSVIAESLVHGAGVRALDVPDVTTGDEQHANTDLF